eukprot:6115048-Amphidinium_carterae.1
MLINTLTRMLRTPSPCPSRGEVSRKTRDTRQTLHDALHTVRGVCHSNGVRLRRETPPNLRATCA